MILASNPADLIGTQCGQLTVRSMFYAQKRYWYLCDCSCGTVGKRVRRDEIMSGKRQSCGCATMAQRKRLGERWWREGTR